MMDSSGRVNWLHIQALHHVVSMHVVELREDEQFDFVVFPMSLPYTQIVIPKGVDLDQEKDWAGVGGLWRVAFCFCDHRELLSASFLFEVRHIINSYCHSSLQRVGCTSVYTSQTLLAPLMWFFPAVVVFRPTKSFDI
jgi:hypothetical protein